MRNSFHTPQQMLPLEQKPDAAEHFLLGEILPPAEQLADLCGEGFVVGHENCASSCEKSRSLRPIA